MRVSLGSVLAGLAAGLWAASALAAPDPVGYLPRDRAPPVLAILPPPPAAGSPREADDRAAFRATRALKGQPRWDLATRDADLGPETALPAFACALGLSLDATQAPALYDLLQRADVDAEAAYGPAKARYSRPRPFMAKDAADAALCEARTPSLIKSASYPSGLATEAWLWGLILAELAPDRAGPILARARSIGESRVVCGSHYPSDIEAGRLTASILLAALHAQPGFRADLDKARAEMVAARAAAHAQPGQCAIENAAGAHTPY